jgi:hypothetical protein
MNDNQSNYILNTTYRAWGLLKHALTEDDFVGTRKGWLYAPDYENLGMPYSMIARYEEDL